MRFKGFIGPSYTLQSVNAECQRTVNLFPQIDEQGTAREGEVGALFPTPGLNRLATMATGPIRGIHTATDGSVYAVSGSGFYQVLPDWACVLLGTLITSSGRVSMADNGETLVVVDGWNGYTYGLSLGSFAQITGEGWRGADVVSWTDGYFVFNEPNTGNYYISGVNSTSLDPLDIQVTSGSPDVLMSLIVDHREIYLMGSDSVEVHYDSGNADFPFERINGAFFEIGCDAKHSVVKLDHAVYWLGKNRNGNGIVYRAHAYQPARISTHAIEVALQGYASLSDAYAWCYQQDGHSFYCLTVPGSGTTWCFDTMTGIWHERMSGDEEHRGACHTWGHGVHIVGDRADGRIYKLDKSYGTDDGALILRHRTSPHIVTGMTRSTVYSAQLDMQAGVGLDAGVQGADPQAMMQWSSDGGHTWSNEHWVSLGKIGEYKARAIWRRLGTARDRVFRVVVSDPVPVTMLGMELDIQAGAY